VAWRRRTITGTVNAAQYFADHGFNDGRPALRNSPVISATIQIPTSISAGTKIPVMIGFGGAGWADWPGTELMVGFQQSKRKCSPAQTSTAQPTAIQPEGNAFRGKLCKVLRCQMG